MSSWKSIYGVSCVIATHRASTITRKNWSAPFKTVLGNSRQGKNAMNKIQVLCSHNILALATWLITSTGLCHPVVTGSNTGSFCNHEGQNTCLIKIGQLIPPCYSSTYLFHLISFRGLKKSTTELNLNFVLYLSFKTWKLMHFVVVSNTSNVLSTTQFESPVLLAPELGKLDHGPSPTKPNRIG